MNNQLVRRLMLKICKINGRPPSNVVLYQKLPLVPCIICFLRLLSSSQEFFFSALNFYKICIISDHAQLFNNTVAKS